MAMLPVTIEPRVMSRAERGLVLVAVLLTILCLAAPLVTSGSLETVVLGFDQAVVLLLAALVLVYMAHLCLRHRR